MYTQEELDAYGIKLPYRPEQTWRVRCLDCDHEELYNDISEDEARQRALDAGWGHTGVYCWRCPEHKL